MPGPDDLFDAAVELLGAAAEIIATTPGGPILYQAVWYGPPAYDCVPMLVVHAGGPSIAGTYPLQPPLAEMQRTVTTRNVYLAQLTITVLRCLPTVEEQGQTLLNPDPAVVTAAARIVLADGWALWNGLIARHRAGTLFGSPSGRREFMLETPMPVRPQGGAGGWEIPVRFQLGSYCP